MIIIGNKQLEAGASQLGLEISRRGKIMKKHSIFIKIINEDICNIFNSKLITLNIDINLDNSNTYIDNEDININNIRNICINEMSLLDFISESNNSLSGEQIEDLLMEFLKYFIDYRNKNIPQIVKDKNYTIR